MTNTTTPPTEIFISELRLAGSDGGDFLGYYAKGHHSAFDFVAAATEFARQNGIWAEPKMEAVKTGFWRTVQIKDDPGEFQFSPSRPGHGAWAVTFIDTFGPSLKSQQLQYNLGRASGYEDGARDVAQLAYAVLPFGSDEAKKFRTAFEEWRREKR